MLELLDLGKEEVADMLSQVETLLVGIGGEMLLLILNLASVAGTADTGGSTANDESEALYVGDRQTGEQKVTGRVLVETLADVVTFLDLAFNFFLFSAFTEFNSDLVFLTVSLRLSFFCPSLYISLFFSLRSLLATFNSFLILVNSFSCLLRLPFRVASS